MIAAKLGGLGARLGGPTTAKPEDIIVGFSPEEIAEFTVSGFGLAPDAMAGACSRTLDLLSTATDGIFSAQNIVAGYGGALPEAPNMSVNVKAVLALSAALNQWTKKHGTNNVYPNTGIIQLVIQALSQLKTNFDKEKPKYTAKQIQSVQRMRIDSPSLLNKPGMLTIGMGTKPPF